MSLRKTLLQAALCFCLPYFGVSQSNNYTEDRPTASAVSFETEPIIDGDVKNDAVWQAIAPFGGLQQTQPHAGQAASEQTEIRVAYSATTFYVSVVCYDKEPGKLVVSDARRDASLDNTDSFVFILDTYNDGQNGFVFGTNSMGVEYDAQVVNEGQGGFGGRQQSGNISGFNINWDGSWEVKAKVWDFGWSAEFAIPLRTLRFTTGQDQTWGANFRRNIRKTNEVAYWAPMPIEFNLNRLSLAGKLTGLNLQSPGNLKVIPYALVNVNRDFEEANSETKIEPEVGVDVKYSITPSLTLDLTYNTDFAQVEVDEQQVNLDRFNLFFPEKRPFFLENAGLFSVGSPGEVDVFFSRRIGIGENGQQVPIIGGARLSGKVKKTNIGLLSMFTDEVEEEGIAGNNFSVARVSHEFAKRSSIGAAFVNRQGMGELEDDYNRTYAADGKLGIGEKGQISGFYAQTATPGIEDAKHAYKFESKYEWNGLILSGAYTEVGEGFNPEVGFLRRSAFRKPEFLIFKRIRPEGKFGLMELRPHASYRSYFNFDGFMETSFLHVDNHWEWENGMEIHTGINFTVEGVQEAFPISIRDSIFVDPGTYRHKEAQLVFRTNESKTISVSLLSIMGGFFGGTRLANRGSVQLRLGDKFNSEFSLSHNDISLPNGDFTTDIFGARLSYSFTPHIYTQSLIQYNSVADIWTANIRFGWLQQANTGLFVVYNETRGENSINNRSFIVKYSRVFDVIK